MYHANDEQGERRGVETSWKMLEHLALGLRRNVKTPSLSEYRLILAGQVILFQLYRWNTQNVLIAKM